MILRAPAAPCHVADAGPSIARLAGRRRSRGRDPAGDRAGVRLCRGRAILAKPAGIATFPSRTLPCIPFPWAESGPS